MKPVKAIRTQPKRYNSQILLRLNNFRLNSPFQSFFCQSHSRIPNGILNPVRFHIPNGILNHVHFHIPNGIWYFRVRISLNVFPFQLLSVLNS